MAIREQKFRQAALAYGGLGIVVVLLTLWMGGVPARKAVEIRLVIPGVVAILLFGIAFYFTETISQWSASLGRVLVFLMKLFVVTNGLRALNFLVNFLGLHVELHFRPMVIHFHPSQFAFHPIFLLNSLLMAAIASMLARAAWDL